MSNECPAYNVFVEIEYKILKKYEHEKRLRKLWTWVALNCAAGVILMAVLGVIV